MTTPMDDITDIGGEPTNDELAEALDLLAIDLLGMAQRDVSRGIRLAAKRLRASRSPAAGVVLARLNDRSDVPKRFAPGHPDAYLNALLDYTSGLYGVAREAGIPAAATADAMAHIERAARGLHALCAAGVEESLDRALGETIDERDAAEYALGVAYRIVVGRDPEWSNVFGYADALENIQEVMLSAAPSPPSSADHVPGVGNMVQSETRSPDGSAPSAAWRPIDTAPKDCTAVLIYSPIASDPGVMLAEYREYEGYDEGNWFDRWNDEGPPIDADPTHWMPLPEPPTLDDGAGNGGAA